MNTFLIIANVLLFVAFVIHTFVGDKELSVLAPEDQAENALDRREKWTMARCGWHWISFDLLFASIGLGLIIFTDVLPDEATLLSLLSIYLMGYGLVWLLVIMISKPFPARFLKLGQWILLVLISGLIYMGS